MKPQKGFMTTPKDDKTQVLAGGLHFMCGGPRKGKGQIGNVVGRRKVLHAIKSTGE